MSIADFLRARYGECRAIADTAANLQCDPENGWGVIDHSGYAKTEKRRWIAPHIGMLHEAESAEHVVANNPAVVLADLDAKLAVVDEHPDVNDGDCGTCVNGRWGYPTHGGSSPQRYPCRTLRLLAVPFAAHPDYDERWRP